MPVGMRGLAVIAALLLASGCSSMNPVDWLAPDEEANPPAELVELQNQIVVNTLWSTQVGDGMEDLRAVLVPAVAEERVFAADPAGLVIAVERSNGRSQWQVNSKLEISGGPGIGDGLVVVGTSNGEVLALEQQDGSERWRALVSSEVLSVPAVEDGVVAVHTIDGKMFGLDAASGEQIWIYDRTVPVLTLHGSSSPVISYGQVIAGFASGKLVSIDLGSGEVAWEVVVTVPRGRTELERMVDLDGDPLVIDGMVYVTTYQGEMAAVSEDTGVVLWRRDLSAYAGVAADWQQLYASDAEGQVWAVDPRNGSAVWRNKKLAYRKLSPPAVLEEYIVVGDMEGYLHWLSREDGRLLARVQVGSAPISSAPRVLDEVLYVYGNGGQLSALTVVSPVADPVPVTSDQ